MVSLAQYAQQVGWFTTYYSCLYLYFYAYSYDTYIIIVRCTKLNKDAVWSLVQLLVTGVRADPKYSYSHVWYHMYVREDLLLLIFYWNILFLVDTWSSVVVSRYDCFSVSITCGATHAGRILFDTKRKRENSGVWPFEVRVMLLRSRAWMILAGTHHTTVVSHRYLALL